MRQPKFLFILTPPFCGSTALAMLLNTSPRSMVLTEKAEGQLLIPSLFDADRWNPDKIVNWDHVKQTWYQRYYIVNRLVGTVDVIIEKSPPNMVRINQYLEAFPNSVCFSFNRDPYASCASYLYRRHSPQLLSQKDREKVVIEITEKWLNSSRYIKTAIDSMKLLHFNYEEFCADPEGCTGRVLNICPELVSVDCYSAIKVKDYPEQHISNQNSRQINMLTSNDIDSISSKLSDNADLLEYFGYTIM